MKKRSVSIRGHRTSLSLEDIFWDELGAMAEREGLSVAALIARIDNARMANGGPSSGLSSAVRTHVVEHLRQAKEKTPSDD